QGRTAARQAKEKSPPVHGRNGTPDAAERNPDGGFERTGFCPIILHPIRRLERKEADMESIISNLLARVEKGSLSRRELVRSLAMLAAGSTAAAAQEDIDFSGANIDHVSIQVADVQRSVDFYQKMFGFSVISQDQPHGIIRLGTTRTLVS